MVVQRADEMVVWSVGLLDYHWVAVMAEKMVEQMAPRMDHLMAG
jgi:hypothetical protein